MGERGGPPPHTPTRAPLPFLYHLYTPRRDALYLRLLPLILIPTHTSATNTSNHRNTRKLAAATTAAPPTVDGVATLIRGESLSVDGGGRVGGGGTVVAFALGVREVGLCARVGARRKKGMTRRQRRAWCSMRRGDSHPRGLQHILVPSPSRSQQAGWIFEHTCGCRRVIEHLAPWRNGQHSGV